MGILGPSGEKGKGEDRRPSRISDIEELDLDIVGAPQPFLLELLQMTRDLGELEIPALIRVLRQDPRICTALLRLANSAYYGFSYKIETLERAVPLIGLRRTTELAVSLAVRSAYSTADTGVQHLSHQIWRHSMLVADISETLARFGKTGLESEAFLAGVLHDVGVYPLLAKDPESYALVLAQAKEEQRLLIDVEKEVLGIDHQEVGGKLCEGWLLPERLTRVITAHHDHGAALGPDETLLGVVRTAEVVAAQGTDEFPDSPVPEEITQEELSDLSLSQEDAARALEGIGKGVERCAALAD
jgi:putative nucleotidyltransferase with HDIG domain